MNTFNVTAEPGSLTSAPAHSAAVSPIPGDGHTVLPGGPPCWAPPGLPTPGSGGSGTPVRAAFKRPDPNRPPAHRPPPSSRATLRLTVSRRGVVTKAATPCRWLRSPSFPWGLAVPRRSVRIAGAERGSGTGRRRLRRRRGLTYRAPAAAWPDCSPSRRAFFPKRPTVINNMSQQLPVSLAQGLSVSGSERRLLGTCLGRPGSCGLSGAEAGAQGRQRD